MTGLSSSEDLHQTISILKAIKGSIGCPSYMHPLSLIPLSPLDLCLSSMGTNDSALYFWSPPCSRRPSQFPYSVSTLDSASLEPLSEQALIQIVSSYKPLGYSDLRLMKLPYLLYKRMSHGIFFLKNMFLRFAFPTQCLTNSKYLILNQSSLLSSQVYKNRMQVFTQGQNVDINCTSCNEGTPETWDA